MPPLATLAAVFSNSATQVPAVREACERMGIALDVVGAASGNGYNEAPEVILGRYDVVFAKARSALEAAAVGCAVVLCDAGGLGPLLDPANAKDHRRLNFGFRTLTEPVSPQAIAERLARYSPDAAAQVSGWVRSTAGLESDSLRVVGELDAVLAEPVAIGHLKYVSWEVVRVARAECAGPELEVTALLRPIRAGRHRWDTAHRWDAPITDYGDGGHVERGARCWRSHTSGEVRGLSRSRLIGLEGRSARRAGPGVPP